MTPPTVPRAAAPAVATAAQPAGAVLIPAIPAGGPPLPADPILGLLTEGASVVNALILPDPTAPPIDPVHLLILEVVRRFEAGFGLPVAGAVPVTTSDPVTGGLPPATAASAPRPEDAATTAYGDIGKWLLEPSGEVSHFGGQRLGGKALIEPINVIIVDPSSTTADDATRKLYATLSRAGFPPQPVHTTGFQALVDGTVYGQQPAGIFESFSDNFFLLPDDHARAFGPAPLQNGAGYVWTVAASREQIGLAGLLPTHVYISYDAARDELAHRLALGGATYVGAVALGNAYVSATEVTGDHDGYALVLQLGD